MNYGNSCGANNFSYNQDFNPNLYQNSCCLNPSQFQAEPLIPTLVSPHKRQSTKVSKISYLTELKAQKGRRKKSEKEFSNDQQPLAECTKADEANKSFKKRSTIKRPTLQKPRPSNAAHPEDCGCVNCDKSGDFDDDGEGNCNTVNPQKKESKPILSKHSTIVSMTKQQSTEKSSKKMTLNDMSEIGASRTKVSTVNYDDESDPEVWLLHCPKNFDFRQMLCNEIRRTSKQSEIDCNVERFDDMKTLAVIAPEKAAEYELICENIKLVKVVGKLEISGNSRPEDFRMPKNSLAADCQSIGSKSQSGVSKFGSDVESVGEDCEDDADLSSDREVKPIGGKRLSKKINDQRFTIETTVTVGKVSDRKKSKKTRGSDESCLPFVPSEPSPMSLPTKNKKRSKRDSMK